MKKFNLTIVKGIFISLVCYFLLRYLLLAWEDIKGIDFATSLIPLLVAFVFGIVYKFGLSLLWHYITLKNKAAISFEKSIICWFYSLLGKYIPGKVFLLGGRLYYYHLEGVSKQKVTYSFLLENIGTLIGAVFLFLVSLLFTQNTFFNDYRLPALLLLLLMLIVIHPRLMQIFSNIVLRAIKKEPVSFDMHYFDVLKVVGLFLVNWCILGIGFFILVNSIYTVGVEHFFYVSGTFGLAIVIGLFSFFTASGIGVREGIIIFALSAIMPEVEAVVVSILSRLWMTSVELILLGIVFVYAKIKKIRFENIDEKCN